MLTIAGGIILAGVIGLLLCVGIAKFMQWCDAAWEADYRRKFTTDYRPLPPSE